MISNRSKSEQKSGVDRLLFVFKDSWLSSLYNVSSYVDIRADVCVEI